MSTAAAPAIHPGVREFLSRSPLKLLIGGKWVPAVSGKTFATANPATGETLAQVAEGGAADVDAAVAAARKAFEGSWSKISPSERSKILYRFAELIEKNAEELAQLETLDNGKPIREAKNGDLPLEADLVRYFAG